MGTSLNGPLTNKDAVGGPRFGRTRAPHTTTDPEFFVFYDEFVSDVVTVGTVATSPWTTIHDTGTTLALAGAPNGVLQMTSASTQDDDGSSLQLSNLVFDFSSTNEGWFETRVLLTDGDQTDVFAGFTIAFTTNPEAVLLAADRIGFELIEESAEWNCVTERSGTETRKVCNGSDVDGLLRTLPTVIATDLTSAVDPDDAAWVKLGIHVFQTNDNGGGIVEFFIDDVLVCTTLTNIPDDVILGIALFQLNGETANNSLYVDYIYAAGTR